MSAVERAVVAQLARDWDAEPATSEQPLTVNVGGSKTYLTITPDGRVVLGDDITMDEAAEQLLRASSAYVVRLAAERDAATERADRLEAAGNAMAEAIRHGIRDGLRDCGEGCEHPACRLMRAEKRWRALIDAGDVAPQTDAGSDPC